MSPEIVNEESHDYGVDIWCLGILLFEMLHGNPPFNAENLTEIKKEFQKKKITVDPKFDKDTIDLIDQLLRYDPDERITIAQALNHRAIQKNLKHIRRKITQEEYNLLTRYYYMNSGGNQLMTHNSTYARQLKRQSMLTKTSQGSFRSHDSNFFEKSSLKEKSNFFDLVGKQDSGSQMRPENMVNDFKPLQMEDESQGMEMINKLATSAFKKKGELDKNDLEENPALNVETKESERFLDTFKKGPGNSNDTGVNVQGRTLVEESSLERKTSQDVQYQNLSNGEAKEAEKVKNHEKAQPEAEQRKKPEAREAPKREESAARTSQPPKRVIEPPKKREPPKKKEALRDPTKPTTLEEFQKKYNTETLKKKFQNEQKIKKNVNPARPVKKEVPKKKKFISDGQIKLVSNKPQLALNPKNNIIKMQDRRAGAHQSERERVKPNMSKSPSTGTVYLNQKAQAKGGQVQMVQRRGDAGQQRQANKPTNLTLINKKKPNSIFSNIYSKANPVSTEKKPMTTFKSVTHAPSQAPIQMREYKSTTQTQPTQSIRVQNQPVRKLTSISPQRNGPRLEAKSDIRDKPVTNLISEHTSIDKFGREVRTRHTQTVFKIFDEIKDVEKRFSEGVHRSRTVDKKTPKRDTGAHERQSDQQVKHLTRLDNKKKLSQIFEEPMSQKKHPKREKNVSLFDHLKKKSGQGKNLSAQMDPKFVNLTDVEAMRRDINGQASDSRSKSNELTARKANQVNGGHFNRRVVYVNGVKTEKLIFSKKNQASEQKPDNKPSPIEEDKRPSIAEPRQAPLSERKESAPVRVDQVEEAKHNEAQDKTDESEMKKKYKIITVPQTKARVIQEGGLKFSNVKPITIIQQGNFALSSSRNQNPQANSSLRKVDNEETMTESQLPKKIEEEKLETVTVKTENENKETTITQRRVISYKEYKRRIQKNQRDKKKQGTDSESRREKPPPRDDVSRDENLNPKVLGQYRSLSRGKSVDVQRKHVHRATMDPLATTKPKKSPVVTHLSSKNNWSIPNQQMDPFGNVIRTQSGPHRGLVTGTEDINSLVKKLDQMNQPVSSGKNKTTGSISLTKLIKDAKRDSRQRPQAVDNSKRFQKFNETNAFREPNHIFSHKKNKTMQHLTHQNVRTAHRNMEKTAQNYATPTSRNLSLSRKAQTPKPTVVNEAYSQSTKRNYEPKKDQSNQVWNLNNTSTNRRATQPEPNVVFRSRNQTRVQENQHAPLYVANSQKASSKRQMEMDFQNRYSYGRRGWQAIISSPVNLKQSNSMSRLRQNGKDAANVKSSSVYQNKKSNYTAQTSPVNYKTGNVTTTIRRYMVHPSPTTTKYRFESHKQNQPKKNPLSKNSNMVNVNYKNQIFTNLKELKKNLKTNYYNQK